MLPLDTRRAKGFLIEKHLFLSDGFYEYIVNKGEFHRFNRVNSIQSEEKAERGLTLLYHFDILKRK